MLNLHIPNYKSYKQRALFPKVHIKPDQTWNRHRQYDYVCDEVRDSVYREEDTQVAAMAMWYGQVPQN